MDNFFDYIIVIAPVIKNKYDIGFNTCVTFIFI